MSRRLAARAGDAVRVVGPPLLFIVFCLVVWELLAGRGDARNPVVPPPSRVWQAFLDTSHLLPAHLRTTLTEAFAGVGLGVAAGITLAVVTSAWGLVRRVIQPLLVASQTIPVQVLAPLLVLWFGFGLAPKIVIVALVVFFPVAVSTASGLASADRELVDLVRSYGAGRGRLLRMVLVPSALPGLFAGLRISLTYAVASAVIAESIGASSGLGLYLERSRRAFRYDQVFVGIAIVTLVSVALFGLVHLLSRLACPWLHLDRRRAAGPAERRST